MYAPQSYNQNSLDKELDTVVAKRNQKVEDAVNEFVSCVDRYLDDSTKTVGLLPPLTRRVTEELFKKSSSIALCASFLVFYKLVEITFDFDQIPSGTRGKYGDKKLSEELTIRHITEHGRIVSFGENIGSKGAVKNFSLQTDPRFETFINHVKLLSNQDLKNLSCYIAWKYASSQRIPEALPPISPDTLTFVRAKKLLHELLSIKSNGSIQQLLLAGLLYVLKERQQITIRTHHPNAADRYDHSAGDIEEVKDDKIIAAYEITVRPDWKNRISSFQTKMDKFNLKKYIIIASNVNLDSSVSEPSKLGDLFERYERDIAVLDILDVVNYLAAELSAEELRRAINKTDFYLRSPSLCGVATIVDSYTEAVGNWLDSLEVRGTETL